MAAWNEGTLVESEDYAWEYSRLNSWFCICWTNKLTPENTVFVGCFYYKI